MVVMNKPTQEATSWCLVHQLPETQASRYGKVCPKCKQKIYTGQLEGMVRRFWDSQPGAYLMNGEPCFVYNLIWDNFQIRSLQFFEPASPICQPSLLNEFEALTRDDIDHITELLKQRGLIQDIVPDPPASENSSELSGFEPPELDLDFGLDLPDFESPEWEQD
ncbi:MAG: hypothetical protein R3C11_23960 [Planctomycetaceae bacterium]